MARTPVLWILFVAFISLASAAAPTFCKCTCFKNSTIIPLGPESESEEHLVRRSWNFLQPGFASAGIDKERRIASTSCSECTKAFCLDQGIDICKDADEEDVMTMCFQRDSNKDKIIVWGFIVGTVGLLGWALFKRVMAWREERAFARQDVNYAPISSARR